MGKTLLAIVNARHRADWRAAIRRTWLPQVPRDRADVFFFVGQGDPIPDPERVIELSCSDVYNDLPSKIQTMVQWALRNGYEHFLKIDDDVVLRPLTFLDSGYENHEFSGGENRPGAPAVTFGFCYVLGKKAMEIVSKSRLPHDFDDEKWVAQCLWAKSIPLMHFSGYSLHISTSAEPDVQIARCVHLDNAHSQEQKIREFERIFNSPPWTGKVESSPVPFKTDRRRIRYEADGCTVNWWSRRR